MPLNKQKLQSIAGAVAGVALCLTALIIWYPQNLWSYPMQNADSMHHFNAVARFISEGPGIFLDVTGDGRFYPPLFHFIAYLIYCLAGLFGAHLSVATCISLTWFLIAGVVWPLGVLKLTNTVAPNTIPKQHSLQFLRTILIMLLALCFTAYPYMTLEWGTLYAYGAAIAFIPFIIAYYIERKWLQCGIFTVILLIMQPRAIFGVLLVVLPFVVVAFVRLIRDGSAVNRRKILLICGGVIVFIGAVGGYVVIRMNPELLFHPERWFSGGLAVISPQDAILNVITQSSVILDAPGGAQILPFDFIMIGLMVITLAFTLIRIHRTKFKFDYITCMAISFLLVGAVYVLCIAGENGNGIINLITAPWYKQANRVWCLMPIVLVPLSVSACGDFWKMVTTKWKHKTAPAISVGVLAIFLLFINIQFGNSFYDIKVQITTASTITDDPMQLLNQEKIDFFQNVRENLNEISYTNNISTSSERGNASVSPLVLTAPESGGAYIYALEGIPIVPINRNPDLLHMPMLQNFFTNFDGGTPEAMLTSACALNSNGEVFFLDVDNHQPTLNELGIPHFAPLNNGVTIDQFAAEGALLKITTSDQGNYTLYKVNC